MKFDKKIELSFAFWWNLPAKAPMYLYGPTGCGKTAAAMKIAEGLSKRKPLSITCSPGMRKGDFLGSLSLKNGETHFNESALLRAFKHGGVVIVNEVDVVDAGELVGLNDVAERGELFIPQTGECVGCHPEFMLICTANTGGLGDLQGGHGTRQILDLAFLNRFMCIHMDYMDANLEQELLQKKLPVLPEALQVEVAKQLVTVAGRVRAMYSAGEIEVTFSTRQLLNVCDMLCMSYADFGRKTPAQIEENCRKIAGCSPLRFILGAIVCPEKQVSDETRHAIFAAAEAQFGSRMSLV